MCASQQQRRVIIGVHRHEHVGELGKAVDPAARGREVEIDEADGDPVAVDDVLEAHIVVADHRIACRIGHLRAPHRIGGRHEPLAHVVEPPQHRGRGCQRQVTLRPSGIRRAHDVAVDELQPLAAIRIDTDRDARSLEPDSRRWVRNAWIVGVCGIDGRNA